MTTRGMYRFAAWTGLALILTSTRATAAEQLCDPSFEHCRTPLIELIRNETVGIDVAFWFMTDARYTSELIRKWRQGVPIRVIVDPRANPTYSANALRLQELQDAGIPMRRKVSTGILHWKMMLFAGQNTVQFSAANYTDQAFVPRLDYQNYVDEVIYFSDDPAVVNSFKTKYDDLWTDTSRYGNYANVVAPLSRRYPTFSKDPELNFPPRESFRSRSIARYNAETQQIDAIMFRITDRRHTDALIAALARGVRVRLITDWGQYTWSDRMWHSWNVDRLYRAGAQIRVAGERADRPSPSVVGHLGTVHQKSTLLYSQGMTVFGSSNWTSPSSDSQEEHNYFTTKPAFFAFFRDQFERKWSNGNPIGAIETEPLVPLPPDRQANVSPANGAAGVSAGSVTLRWHSGIWTHVYDVYAGTTADPPLVVADRELGPSMHATDDKSVTITGLQPGTTYYWRVVGKTMAGVERSSPIWSFTTSGTALAPPSSLPSGWSNRDIGAVAAAGSASASGGSFTVTGSGADIWGSADEFQFAYRTVSGDFDVSARVATVQNVHLWTKAGLMIRETTQAGSRHASIFSTPTADKPVAFQRRTSTGGTSLHTGGSSIGPPVWVRLVRVGHAVSAYYRRASSDAWTLVATQTFNALAGSVHVGLAVTSHADGTLATATFDNVTLSAPTAEPPPASSLPSGWSRQDIGAVGAAGSAAASAGTFTVNGSGADIWGTADEFHFAYQIVSGNFDVSVRVATVENVDRWTKAGLMVRETTQAGSRHASIFSTPATEKPIAFQRRTATNGSSVHTGGPFIDPPVWLRLVRSGDALSAYYRRSSTEAWVLVGSQTLSGLAASVHVGLAVTAHADGRVATATFDNFSLGQ